jgi:glucans biosynthesis protein
VKTNDNPMQSAVGRHVRSHLPSGSDLGIVSCCGARTRSGKPCRSYSMANGRCRMHGGRGSGAPQGSRNGNWRHGGSTKEGLAERRQLRALVRELRSELQALTTR